MQTFLRSHRWVVLAAGAAIQILTGVPAAWGVFQRAVCETYALRQQTAALIFSVVICAFGIGCVMGGLLQDKKGPRVSGLLGTALLSAGFVAAAFVPKGAPWLFYGAFSVPVGLGCALLYPAVMSCAQQWYADRKGFATGVIGGAVGLSGAVLTLAGRFLIKNWDVRTAFWVLGAGMALVCGAACLVLENPQGGGAQTPAPGKADQSKAQDTPKYSGVPPVQKKQAASDNPTRQTAKSASPEKEKQPPRTFTTPQMLKTPQYWLLTAAVCLATPAMLLFSPIIVELGTARGLPEAAALSCVVVGSLFSAAGRLLMPWCSDKIGRRSADLILFALLCGASLAFWFAQSWWVLVVYCALAFAYSGEAAVIPAVVTDLFGLQNTGLHYGLAALGMSVGSLLFPLVAGLWDSTTPRHAIAIAATAAGFVCVWLLKPTAGERL
ncbi:MAG: MFS transporter [Ruthenibacterium sp.]